MSDASASVNMLGRPNEGEALDPEARENYQAGTGRRIAFSIIFILLLPFFISLGPMIFWRLWHGQWLGTVGLIILAVAFAAIMFLIFVELLFSIRSEVAFGEKSVHVSLPSGRGPTPLLRYVDRDIAYSDVDQVEMRREIYGGSMAPMLLKGARVKLKDGDYVKLGYVNEANTDPALPFPEIGEKIAARAGVPIVDMGNVRRTFSGKVLGVKSQSSESMNVEESEIADLNRRHGKFIMILTGVLVVLVGLGIAIDRDTRMQGFSLFSQGTATDSR